MFSQQVILAGGLAALGIVQLVLTLARLPRLIAATRWKEAESEVLSSDLEPTPPYKVTVTYRYVVDGAAYVGDQIHPGGIRSRTYEQSTLTFHKYRPKASVTVYYDPRAPGRAALETDASWPLFISLSTALALLYLAARLAIDSGLL
jgi:uncharacterized protein DUF3592